MRFDATIELSDAAKKQIERVGWQALVNADPARAVDVMEVVMGTRISLESAGRAIALARDGAPPSMGIESTVAAFKHSQFDSTPSTTLHRIMTGKRV